MISEGFWSEWGDSNARSLEPKSSAIPTSLHPDIHFSAMIPWRGVKIKIFLSVVIYVVKGDFVPLSAIGESPANTGVTRLCGISPCPVPDTATALPKQARYQLRYTRLLSFLSGWSYSPKCGAVPAPLYPVDSAVGGLSQYTAFRARFQDILSRPGSWARHEGEHKRKSTIFSDGAFWSGRRGSNSLPRPWQGRALPDELRPQTQD